MDIQKLLGALPEKGIAGLQRIVKIYFRTPDQTQKIINFLKQYAKEIAVLGSVEEAARCIEEAVEAENKKLDAYSKKSIGQRVRVKDGSNTSVVGFGTYEGQVDVYVVKTAEGNLLSDSNAEVKPEYIPPGGVLVKLPNNPKIRLDNGKVVYGCQVWWELIPPERDVLPVYQHAGQSYTMN